MEERFVDRSEQTLELKPTTFTLLSKTVEVFSVCSTDFTLFKDYTKNLPNQAIVRQTDRKDGRPIEQGTIVTSIVIVTSGADELQKGVAADGSLEKNGGHVAKVDLHISQRYVKQVCISKQFVSRVQIDCPEQHLVISRFHIVPILQLQQFSKRTKSKLDFGTVQTASPGNATTNIPGTTRYATANADGWINRPEAWTKTSAETKCVAGPRAASKEVADGAIKAPPKRVQTKLEVHPQVSVQELHYENETSEDLPSSHPQTTRKLNVANNSQAFSAETVESENTVQPYSTVTLKLSQGPNTAGFVESGSEVSSTKRSKVADSTVKRQDTPTQPSRSQFEQNNTDTSTASLDSTTFEAEQMISNQPSAKAELTETTTGAPMNVEQGASNEPSDSSRDGTVIHDPSPAINDNQKNKTQPFSSDVGTNDAPDAVFGAATDFSSKYLDAEKDIVELPKAGPNTQYQSVIPGSLRLYSDSQGIQESPSATQKALQHATNVDGGDANRPASLELTGANKKEDITSKGRWAAEHNISDSGISDMLSDSVIKGFPTTKTTDMWSKSDPESSVDGQSMSDTRYSSMDVSKSTFEKPTSRSAATKTVETTDTSHKKIGMSAYRLTDKESSVDGQPLSDTGNSSMGVAKSTFDKPTSRPAATRTVETTDTSPKNPEMSAHRLTDNESSVDGQPMSVTGNSSMDVTNSSVKKPASKPTMTNVWTKTVETTDTSAKNTATSAYSREDKESSVDGQSMSDTGYTSMDVTNPSADKATSKPAATDQTTDNLAKNAATSADSLDTNGSSAYGQNNMSDIWERSWMNNQPSTVKPTVTDLWTKSAETTDISPKNSATPGYNRGSDTMESSIDGQSTSDTGYSSMDALKPFSDKSASRPANFSSETDRRGGRTKAAQQESSVDAPYTSLNYSTINSPSIEVSNNESDDPTTFSCSSSVDDTLSQGTVHDSGLGSFFDGEFSTSTLTHTPSSEVSNFDFTDSYQTASIGHNFDLPSITQIAGIDLSSLSDQAGQIRVNTPQDTTTVRDDIDSATSQAERSDGKSTRDGARESTSRNGSSSSSDRPSIYWTRTNNGQNGLDLTSVIDMRIEFADETDEDSHHSLDTEVTHRETTLSLRWSKYIVWLKQVPGRAQTGVVHFLSSGRSYLIRVLSTPESREDTLFKGLLLWLAAFPVSGQADDCVFASDLQHSLLLSTFCLPVVPVSCAALFYTASPLSRGEGRLLQSSSRFRKLCTVTGLISAVLYFCAGAVGYRLSLSHTCRPLYGIMALWSSADKLQPLLLQ